MARYDAARPRGRTRLKHWAEYVLLRGTVALLRLLPLRLALWIARRLGDLAFDGLRLRRRVALDNLRHTFGATRTERERVAIARRCYRNFAMTFIELALWARRPAGELDARVEIAHPERATRAAAAGRGILYLTAHYGNWELLGARVNRLTPGLHVVVGDQRNLLVDRVARDWRERLGMRVIPMASAVRDTLRVLQHGGYVALVADQDGGPGGLFFDFLGRPASHFTGPARLAYRAGSPIVMGFCLRTGPGVFHAELTEPILPDRSRPEAEEIERILRAYDAVLEREARAHPDQWFWMHRRWKTRPPDPAG